MTSHEQSLEAAHAAYSAHDLETARDAFAEAERSGVVLSAQDLETYGYAELLLGDATLATLERAYAAYEAADRPHDAVRTAIDIGHSYGMRGHASVAMGWIRRAERALEGHEEGPGHARVTVLRGAIARSMGRPREAVELAERAHAIARRYRDTDTQGQALCVRGGALISLGRTEEAKADLDEAMLLVRQGSVRPLTGGFIYCVTIDACRDMSDFERAFEWSECGVVWTTERRVFCMPGICRVHRAELLRIRGDHESAQSETRAAIELAQRLQVRSLLGTALGELGNQHLEMGDLDGAEEAYENAHEAGHEQLPGIAVVRLRRGDAAGAHAILETALGEREEQPLRRAELLPALVETLLTMGDVARAAEAAKELQSIATTFDTLGLRASASASSARVHLAAGDVSRALASARAATRAWNLLGARHELAGARELLASAYAAAGDSVRAKVEEEAVRAWRSAIVSSSTGRTDPRAATMHAVAEPKPLLRDVRIREGVIIEGKIEVGPVLGIGGMGIVHSGRHRVTGRAVAIKVLKSPVCHDDPECVRFLREALACGRVRHPNVVDIYDAGHFGGEPYIVMELLSGTSLSDRLEQSRLELPLALAVAERAARGVAAAHAVGIIHRDLKPANIFIDDADVLRVKVLDFGLSKLPERGQTEARGLLGTPFYMAPEQISSPSGVDERTDVYGLGAVLFEMLAGQPPFVAPTLPALLMAIANGPAPDLRAHRSDLPDDIVDLVHRALERDPGKRFASAAELADVLAARQKTVAMDLAG